MISTWSKATIRRHAGQLTWGGAWRCIALRDKFDAGRPRPFCEAAPWVPAEGGPLAVGAGAGGLGGSGLGRRCRADGTEGPVVGRRAGAAGGAVGLGLGARVGRGLSGAGRAGAA